MKKEYSKPYLLVESFQLDAAIAASCAQEGKQPMNYGLHTCKLEEEMGAGMTYLGLGCFTNIVDDGDGNDGICYHGPIPYNTMFLAS